MKVKKTPWKHRRRRARPPAPEVPRDDPSEEQWWIHERLLNWAAWCVWRAPQGRAASAEGNYRPPAQGVFNPEAPRTRVNTLQAEETNAALLQVPSLHRKGLLFRYYLMKPDKLIASALDVPPANYLVFMAQARAYLGVVLQRDESRVKLRSDN